MRQNNTTQESVHKYPYISFKNKYCLCKGHLRSPITTHIFPHHTVQPLTYDCFTTYIWAELWLSPCVSFCFESKLQELLLCWKITGVSCAQNTQRHRSAQGFLFSCELAADGWSSVAERWGRIKFLTLLGIKQGSCTSTRGKPMCSCNTSPILARC